MKERILNQIRLLKENFENGNYSNHEYFTLLGELNMIVWGMHKFDLDYDIQPREIQDIIHKEQEAVMTVV